MYLEIGNIYIAKIFFINYWSFCSINTCFYIRFSSFHPLSYNFILKEIFEEELLLCLLATVFFDKNVFSKEDFNLINIINT